MTHTKSFVLAAFLMASTSPMAIGQTDTNTGTTTGAGTGTAATGGDMSEEDMERRQLITMLDAASTTDQDWEAEFENLSSEAEVKIVDLSDLKEADETAGSMLDEAMSDMEDSRDDLQSAIEDNDTLKSALEDEDHSVDDVVAAVVQTGVGNEVTLIVDTESDSDSD